jgi:hypothetical protein
MPAQPLIDMTPSINLKELDQAFIRQFNLASYYPLDPISYQTFYCVTLEEFFDPMLEEYDISPETRREFRAFKVAEAIETAHSPRGGGTLGYNLPGRGAYVNGWLFGFMSDLKPKEAFRNEKVLSHILTTAAHEKLGHGFLAAYSELGKVKSRLGLNKVEIARKFNLRTADDPATSLRVAQDNLLHRVSQLLEEGWATWVASLLAQSVFHRGKHPQYEIQRVVEAIKNLPENIPNHAEIQKALLGSIYIVLGDQDPPFDLLQQAVTILEDVGSMVDDSIPLEQPLRYAVGEMILSQAERNLGMQCMPYAALIAANVTFDPVSVGLTDLEKLLATDPRLNPDVRMVLISRLKPQQKDDVRGMAKMVSAQLSFSVPKELQ